MLDLFSLGDLEYIKNFNLESVYTIPIQPYMGHIFRMYIS